MMQIAVENGFGGMYSQEKAEWMVGAVEQFFQSNADLEPDEIEDFLAELMNNEFDTMVEDGSLVQDLFVIPPIEMEASVLEDDASHFPGYVKSDSDFCLLLVDISPEGDTLWSVVCSKLKWIPFLTSENQRVSQQLCLFFKQCQHGDGAAVHDGIARLAQKKQEAKMVAAKSQPADQSSSEEEDEQEPEEEAMECSASPTMNGPTPPPSNIDVEDGWTLVTKKKK
ncbi:hypothetical protein JD844_010458 [Phrynosoma platyrhinos]|uniref:Pre-rRNA-processing protein TSR2 homolog n=1 Tax=Phrynosoma platyrhinos TaxID=52577 RepID=A0ABQ7TGI2_PHRPL|nr:hypothetical protein JD844_010458 [Phrynosoma platyrhinos]